MSNSGTYDRFSILRFAGDHIYGCFHKDVFNESEKLKSKLTFSPHAALTFIWMYGPNLCDFEYNLGIDLFADISYRTQEYKQVVKLIS